MHELMTRATEVHWEKLLEEAKQNTSTDEARMNYHDKEKYENIFYKLDMGNITFKLDYTFLGNHEEHCWKGEDVTLLLKDDCSCDKEVGFIIDLSFDKHTLFYKQIHETNLDGALKIISQIKLEYNICQCREVSTKGVWCDECYIYRYTRSEDEGGMCCVCHENEGVWVRLDCKHEIHRHCCKLIQEVRQPSGYYKKCPLCRHLSNGVQLWYDK
jgi:hypothetical protein